MKKIPTLLLISGLVILSCTMLSFVNFGSNSNASGPNITFRNNTARGTNATIIYEDMQGMNYRDNDRITLRTINYYTTTSAYRGKQYLSTSVNHPTTTGANSSLTAHTAHYGAANGHRTGGIQSQSTASVQGAAYQNLRISQSQLASSPTTIQFGAIYSASASHEHGVGAFNPDGSVSCDDTSCNAVGTFKPSDITGVWDIEWSAPLGDTILPLLLFMLLYISYKKFHK